MPSYTGSVQAVEDDYWWRGATQYTGTTYLRAEENNIIIQSSYGVAELDMSGLPTGTTNFTITAATLHWYDVQYVKSPKAATVDGYIQMYSGSSAEIGSVYTFTTAPTVGWKSHALTETEWLATIRPDLGANTTSVRFEVNDPLAAQSRLWDVGAFSGGTDAYVVVEFTSGSTSIQRRHRSIVIN